MAKPNQDIPQGDSDEKLDQLKAFQEAAGDQALTTNQGLPLNDDTDSLKAGRRGPTLLEDFHLREKITHFDHERIAERIVHARGSAAHGFFQVYESMASDTKAGFLQDPTRKTPVFVRFSTVAGSRGSSDLARDARGFAVKFYTEEGNYDLVGNNIPVFFIQDAIKFPDLIHAVKPEPNNEMPQAASAHDTFWDFISLMPESMHMIMWVMSDRAIPRSYRMMEGFGVHTFRFVNEAGRSQFVKFHWKPLLGVHSVVWDEAKKISGNDPDFHRRDLWEAIENGDFPEWELGVQLIDEADEHKFDFDLLDATKLIPEELVPVRRIGKMVLNRNPENFFAETEQVAFHPGHLVPGIDFSNDPLLQGRLFSYTDTQLIRLGGPNSHEIPINRAVAPVHNNQRDGHMRQTINTGSVSYQPNTIGGGCPFQAGKAMGGFASHPEAMESPKIRGKSDKFFDHFTQAALFFQSQSPPEQQHMVQALRFELGKVTRLAIRERMLVMLNQIDKDLASQVATGLGINVPAGVAGPLNLGFPADADPAAYQPTPAKPVKTLSPALSMANTPKDSIRTRKVAILAADGVDDASLQAMQQALKAAGAMGKIVAPHGGSLKSANGATVPIDHSLLTTSSVLFDAVFVPGGAASVATLGNEADARHFINEAFKHCKAIAAADEGVSLLAQAALKDVLPAIAAGPLKSEHGVVTGGRADSDGLAREFIEAIAQHRHWSRELKPQVPA
ncbi:MAG: catalase [Candidatus Sericytochromatia bacterium]|nr:catalase [Candidatus Sericytochromatia bacterium]